MSSDKIIEVDGLSKSYKSYGSRASHLKAWLMPWRTDLYTEHCVLNDISFSVNKGESIGIVGQNGAGKSTLLKLLTGTTHPTEGSFKLHGNVSALLELGMGFHGDFTGRQNTYLAGSLLGFSPEQIDQVLPEIEAFAEIDHYFDEPVRTYSSGMQVRLAFSIATAYRPDILIVDEALAVGDAYFQHKCFARIRKYREAGTTLLFVSHDPAAVKSLCDRAILLNKGEMILDAPPQQVLEYYNALIAEKEQSTINQTADEDQNNQTRSGTGIAQITSLKLNNGPARGQLFRVGEEITIEVEFEAKETINHLTTGFLIRDRVGNDIFGTNTWHLGEQDNKTEPGTHTISFTIGKLNLGVGSYSITIALHDSYDHLAGNYDWWDNASVFEVIADKHYEFTGSSFLTVTSDHKVTSGNA